MEDTFSYSARWDSIGLDCSYCKNRKDIDWPDVDKEFSCNLHQLNLSATHNESGYREGEWFCKSFENDGKANSNALEVFGEIKSRLSSNVLYGGYGDNGQLKELCFDQLKHNT